MKIVHILETLGSGGAQGVVYSLAIEQSKMGHNVMVIPTEQCKEDLAISREVTLKKNGIQIVRLNRKVSNKWQLLFTLWKCRKVVTAFKPDVVNSHCTLWHLYGAIACMCKPYKHICTIHSKAPYWPFYLRMMCGKAPLIYCSKSSYEDRTLKNQIVTTIPNGVSPYLVQTSNIVDLKKEWGLSPKAKIIISVGNVRKVKNYKNLIKLSNLLRGTDIHFFICGRLSSDPDYENPDLFSRYLIDTQSNHTSEEHLHCLGTRSDISAIENGADLFLSSSLSEGLPIAVLEAYFNGIPCVLSPIKPHQQIANIPKVWIPRDPSPKAYIEAILEALMTKETHEEILKMRKPYIEKYNISRTAREYVNFYRKHI